MKYIVGIVAILMAIYFGLYIFNHWNAWIGIAVLLITGIVIGRIVRDHFNL